MLARVRSALSWSAQRLSSAIPLGHPALALHPLQAGIE
jgi:hypothetical protein